MTKPSPFAAGSCSPLTGERTEKKCSFGRVTSFLDLLLTNCPEDPISYHLPKKWYMTVR